jgi:hypothetical protein
MDVDADFRMPTCHPWCGGSPWVHGPDECYRRVAAVGPVTVSLGIVDLTRPHDVGLAVRLGIGDAISDWWQITAIELVPALLVQIPLVPLGVRVCSEWACGGGRRWQCHTPPGVSCRMEEGQ